MSSEVIAAEKAYDEISWFFKYFFDSQIVKELTPGLPQSMEYPPRFVVFPC
jgi:hypothetical protein